MTANQPDTPDISIIVPAHNAEATLRGCLDALLAQEIDEQVEVIVVDDGSTDGTPQIAEGRSPRIKLLRQANRGAAAARNTGIRAASGSILLFTDADCEPVPTWAASLAAALREGADGVKGTYRTRQRSITARFVQAEYESKYRRMARLTHIDFIDTYSAGYWRHVFEEAGGFNESISAVEDQEFSFRLAERGYKLRFVPQAVVYHRHADAVTKYLRKKFWIGYWKVRVAALHPERIITDSHTPPSIKVQMALLAIAALTLLPSFFWSLGRRVLAACALAFVSTSAPFLVRLLRSDMAVALLAPAMMLVRAAGLLCGMFAGSRSGGKELVERAVYQAVKRSIDVALSLVLLVVTAPLMPLIALMIKLDSRGPVLFVQWRVGREGKPFRMYKFRTMVENAEKLRPALEATARQNGAGASGPMLKLRPDPRVTRVGRFLRRWSLDELPQLINVLKGEMSLVGPRPEEVDIVNHYSPWHRQRLKVTPGISGPMQVNGRAELSLDERVKLELGYIERRSLVEDARIMARTVHAIVSGHGAY